MWSMLKEINNTSPAGTFHSYVAPGTGHHLSISPDIYTGYVEPGKKDVLSWFSDVLGTSSVNQHVWCEHDGNNPCSWQDYPKEEERERGGWGDGDECPADDQSDTCKMIRSMTDADRKEMEDGFGTMMTGMGTCMYDCCWLQDSLGTIMGAMMGGRNDDSTSEAPSELVEICRKCISFSSCPLAKCLAGAEGCVLYRDRGVRRILEMLCIATGNNITDTLATAVTIEGCCPTACGETAEVAAQQCKGKVDPSCDGALSSATNAATNLVTNEAVTLSCGRILAGVFVLSLL